MYNCTVLYNSKGQIIIFAARVEASSNFGFKLFAVSSSNYTFVLTASKMKSSASKAAFTRATLAARIDILPFFFLKSRRSLTRRKIHVNRDVRSHTL